MIWFGAVRRSIQAGIWPRRRSPSKPFGFTDSIEASPVDHVASLEDLVSDLDSGAVDLLLILGGNPVFNAPVELGLADRIEKARVRAHLSLYEDETTAVCQWSLPE